MEKIKNIYLHIVPERLLNDLHYVQAINAAVIFMGKEQNLLKRFLKGIASQKEAKMVETWLDDAVRKDSPWDSMDTEKKSAVLNDLKKDIDQSIRAGKKPSRGRIKLIWGTIAAAVIVIAMVPIYTLWLRTVPTVSSTLVKEHVARTTTAQIKEVLLPDGSKLWLNANSKLQYNDSFGVAGREVYLTGQAYFEIARDVKHPFIVHSASWQVTVLGTHFDVADYKGDNEVSVAVLNGKVSVRSTVSNHRQSIVHPGEKLNYNKAKDSISSRRFTLYDRPGWIRKEVVFYHSKLTEVAGFMQRNYGLTLEFSRPEIGQMEVSGDFGKVENAESLIQVICLTINAQYTINGKNVMITDMH